MEKPDLSLFDKRDLVRACKLVGYKEWIHGLEEEDPDKLRSRIYSKINPKDAPWRKQYVDALELLDVDYSDSATDDELRDALYDYNRRLLEKRLEKMSDKKKKKLTQQIEEELDPDALEKLHKTSRRAAAAGAMVGKGVLVLQGGAITLTGSNLGLAMLFTTGLKSVSTLIGVTFPFAAYMGAGFVAGKVLAVAGFLTNPLVAIPILGGTLYYAYIKRQNRQYINLAGINYLVESKKKLMGIE